MKKHLMQPKGTRKRFPRLTLTTLLIATAILAIAAVTVVSKQQTKRIGVNEAKKSTKTVTKNPNLMTVKVAGQDVQVDGQTGQIAEPTPEEAQRLAIGLKQLVNQSTEGLVELQHSDGSVSVDLKGRFQNVTVARVNKDGSVSKSCLDNPHAAAKFFGIDPKLIEGPSTTSQLRSGRSPARVERQK